MTGPHSAGASGAAHAGADGAAPCTMVIFGASGDLTARKLIPGLYELYRRGLLPDRFAVLGAGRTGMSDEQFRTAMAAALADDTGDRSRQDRDRFLGALYYQRLDPAVAAEYGKLAERLSAVAAGAGTGDNVLYYLATPPSSFEPIAGGLAGAGLAEERGGAWRRLIVEKPFGYDLQSARALNERLHSWFGERQIYRIDHYLGKETVQNVLVLRFANEVWEPLWTRATIDRVEITAAEQVGVEGRGGYYDGSGALRDMFQNHLLQVVGMIAMEPPAHFRPSAVRNETVKVFDSLRPIAPSRVAEDVVRGQYTGSLTTEGAMAGYREEPGVPAGSSTETYVALRFHIDNRRWAGVPFLVRTGKRLPARVTEVVIHFKQVPHHLFGTPPADLVSGAPHLGAAGHAVSAAAAEASKLIIRIQPDEAIQLRCNVKLPGAGFEVQQVGMDFRYADLADTYLPDAYERLLLDGITGDATLYARADAIESCWEFVQPVLQAWRDQPAIPLHGYPAGSWGPAAAASLFRRPGYGWRTPAPSLVDAGGRTAL
ncbi:MAG: glucose-6-phosphate dehydrogenase [Spirochaetaceae bacterium]|nr:glucose-6-phosphate dehydrogenase [Spirochaetaceae bacterium]